ncbi:MAG: hypothetical protein JXA67_20200 [Micromonosporaceae bacterium]|nr:hypothetical protein [Micromonosporaceae bacterium]
MPKRTELVDWLLLYGRERLDLVLELYASGSNLRQWLMCFGVPVLVFLALTTAMGCVFFGFEGTYAIMAGVARPEQVTDSSIVWLFGFVGWLFVPAFVGALVASIVSRQIAYIRRQTLDEILAGFGVGDRSEPYANSRATFRSKLRTAETEVVGFVMLHSDKWHLAQKCWSRTIRAILKAIEMEGKPNGRARKIEAEENIWNTIALIGAFRFITGPSSEVVCPFCGHRG